MVDLPVSTGLNTEKRVIFFAFWPLEEFSLLVHGDMAILGLIVFYVINVLLRSCDYFNDSNFL